MTVFSEYARYYDLLYRDKDYAGEAAYVHRLIQNHSAGAKTVLNLGCGSGRHDRHLAEFGYEVTGVDISEKMLLMARSAGNGNSALDYLHDDIRTVRLDKRYDVVVSLFHVFSYQIKNEDLKAALATAKSHLKPGGVFIFDCWYGPGVLTDRPAERITELQDDWITVTRRALPTMYPNENCVDVCYNIQIVDKADGDWQEFEETHRMRYLFRPEVELLLKEQNLEIVRFEEWMSGNNPGFGTWNVLWAVQHLPENAL